MTYRGRLNHNLDYFESVNARTYENQLQDDRQKSLENK